MAAIYITDKDEMRELICLSGGQDFMSDVIGGNDSEGRYTTTREYADFEMSEADFCWWEDWALREERIIERANELGEDAIEEVARLGTEHSDLELVHLAQERYLGL